LDRFDLPPVASAQAPLPAGRNDRRGTATSSPLTAHNAVHSLVIAPATEWLPFQGRPNSHDRLKLPTRHSPDNEFFYPNYYNHRLEHKGTPSQIYLRITDKARQNPSLNQTSCHT
jgi:hypothetical protein